jgi:hypothetical protein
VEQFLLLPNTSSWCGALISTGTTLLITVNHKDKFTFTPLPSAAAAAEVVVVVAEVLLLLLPWLALLN